MKKNLIYALFLIPMGFISCTAPAPKSESAPAFDLIKAKTQIDSVDQSIVQTLSKGDSVGLAQLYAPDAKFMIANMPAAVGQKSIQSLFSVLVKGGITKLSLKSLRVWGTDSLLAEEGAYALGTQAGPPDQGKYIVLWKKIGGNWKLYRDMSSSDLPLPKAK